GKAADWGLKPVMHLTTQLIARHQVKAGETVGYGGRYRALRDMTIGVAAIGYGDGYPRHARDGTPVAVDGQITRLVGRVSMDLITIDLTNIQAKVGSVVECWGGTVDINTVANYADTISYELMCQVSYPLRQTATVI
ncbi:MAG TPA: alanine racemase, partial [Halothiobacillaceae bacterium]|nr:alanine racemase [Halothiobacillaceae bacterium]